MGKVYFISGIDTSVGKTAVTGMMARWLLDQGRDVITVKMVQTGNVGYSEDREAHLAAMGIGSQPEDAEGLTAPQIFKFPSSPELAARLENRVVDTAAIASAVEKCAARHEIVLVEGAGGLHVPLTADLLTIDFAAAQGWPLVLVTCGRLGSINHTLLSLEAARSRGMKVAGVVNNWWPETDKVIDADAVAVTKRYLEKWGYAPIVVPAPKMGEGTVDFTAIFGSK